MAFVFDAVVAALDTAQLVRATWPHLIDGDLPTTGQLMACFTSHGGPRLDQLLDLTSLHPISRSRGRGDYTEHAQLPHHDDPGSIASEATRRARAHQLLSNVLQHAGYRRYEAALNTLRDS